MTKRFLVPGWRQGWIVIHDKKNLLKDIRYVSNFILNKYFKYTYKSLLFQGFTNLTTRILGSNTMIQGALPSILKYTPQSFYDNLVDVFHNNAILAYELLKEIRGLKPVMPTGAMYMMIGIDIDNFPEYNTELHFVQDLVKEQSVFCLPGQVNKLYYISKTKNIK